MNWLKLLCVVSLLAGCEDRFRYPCQDPKNWNKQECQRPQCAINGVCPDMLVTPDELKTEK